MVIDHQRLGKKKEIYVFIAGLIIVLYFILYQVKLTDNRSPIRPLYAPYIFTDVFDEKKVQIYDSDNSYASISYSPFNENCQTFEFLPSEWVLKQKKPFDSELESSKCASLHHEILESNQVKWMIYPNKTIENLGCTKKTPMCNPSAHFDNTRNIRINTPPCCRQKILFMFEILTKGFQQLKMPHVLFYGGVMGWARNHQMIPYDEDLDMVVNGSFWRNPSMIQFIRHICDTYGFVANWRSDLEHVSIIYSSQNENGIGVWSYRVKNGKVRVPHYNVKWEFDYDIINPPRPVTFNGIRTFVPNKPMEYLNQTYGTKWKWKELQCKTLDGRKCIPGDEE